MDTESITPPSSVNSFSRESEDVASKYHRLANQYAQIRAQVVVLKKALLDEREKHSYIKDNDVGKGQKIRTLEQEVESLTFRNKQLSTRIDSLRQDLENATKKKGKGKQERVEVTNKDVDSIHLEELESKIRENEILHSKLQTIEESYASKVQALEDNVATLLSAKQANDAVLKASKEDFEAALSKEQRRSSSLQVQVDKLQTKLDAANAALIKSRSNQSSPEPRPSGTKIVKCKNLNIYAKDKKRAGLLDNTLHVMGGYVSDLVTSLLHYTTYSAQRLQLQSEEFGEALTPHSKTLVDELGKSVAHIKPLIELYTVFSGAVRNSQYSMNSCEELKDFSDQFNDMTEYLARVFGLFRKSVTEESMSMSCSLQMEECNTVISDTTQPLILALQNTALSLSHIRHITESATAGRYIPGFIKDLRELGASVRAHLSAIHPKLVLAHKLPATTQRLKTTDECCVASLQSFVNTLTKIVTHLEDSLPLITKPSRFCAEQESVYSATLAQSCADFLSQVNATLPPPTESESERVIPEQLPSPQPSQMTAQLHIAKEKIAKLEQSKEHWMLEAQLLNIKLEKAQKQLKDANDAHSNNSNSNTNNNVPVDNLLDLSDSNNVTNSELPWDDTGLREEAIRVHFTNRVNSLLETVQKAEGECILYKRECKGLRNRLQIAEKQQSQITIDLCNNDKQKKNLEDELALTKDKYESQIALMSEHLCAMNDKLVNLNEENQTLKMDTPKQTRKKW